LTKPAKSAAGKPHAGPDTLSAVLPLRDIVMFPGMIVPLFVGRGKSVLALEAAVAANSQILLAAQKSAAEEEPSPAEMYRTGTMASVLQMLKLPDGTVKVLVEGVRRARIAGFTEDAGFLQAYAEEMPDLPGEPQEVEALVRAVAAAAARHFKEVPGAAATVGQITDQSKLADAVACHLGVPTAAKQELLETPGVAQRLERVLGHMEAAAGVQQAESRIKASVKQQVEKTQRHYFLNEQMKAIQKELGDGDGGKDPNAELEDRIGKTRLTKEAADKARSELKKLRATPPSSPEAAVSRNYLDWMLSLPWKKHTKIRTDVTAAEAILDADHYGLGKVKERIAEYIAVQARSPKVRGPILCLVGPPGVGKTSLGKSIARATGRGFVRMSLGGVTDEAEIRGHRRTYVGSMPGKILQGMKKAKTSNPLFLLDEIDKLGDGHRGDPSSALLEVLDPEQNATFSDHFLEVDYDLSDVMFVTTANSLNMPQALLDRMEIIRIAGYTEDEKMEIARRHLLGKQAEANGLRAGEWHVQDGALRDLIRYYTREAGVRSLEREIAGLARKAVKEIVTGKAAKLEFSAANLGTYAGVRRFSFGETEARDMVGVVNGLAWTEAGGDILTIESVLLPGKGKIRQTGKLGEVMQESVAAALSCVLSRSVRFGIKPTLFGKRDIHVHVPDGGTPKDGPSAGVAMATSIVSVLTGIPVRRDVAMTGEITLRGRVLPVGGLKEKLLAAARGGITTVFIPRDNEKDLAEIPGNIRKHLKIVPVSGLDEVIWQALVRRPEAIEWEEPPDVLPPPALPVAQSACLQN